MLALWGCSLATAESPAGSTIAAPAESPAFAPAPAETPATPASAPATPEAEFKPYTETIPGANVAFDMVPIRGGTFRMGSPPGEPKRESNEGPQFEAEIEPFWMGKHEVTWQEYELWGVGLDLFRRDAQGTEPTERDKLADAITRPTDPYTDMSFGMGKDKRPALCMTQFAAKMYCTWLSAKTGRYYRLPTEAEWEYACRAGTTTAYSFGDDPKLLDEYGWHAGNSSSKYREVGKKKPNPWGLHDMHGNVAEWVLDQFTTDGYEQFKGLRQKSPMIVPTKIEPRVVRGGSWVDSADRLRSAAREGSEKSWKDQDPQIPQSVWYYTDADFVGFRVVRPLRVPAGEEAARYGIDPVEKTAMEEYAKARGFK